jgi:hypothetical protein
MCCVSVKTESRFGYVASYLCCSRLDNWSASGPRTTDLLPFPTQPSPQLCGITEGLMFLKNTNKVNYLKDVINLRYFQIQLLTHV